MKLFANLTLLLGMIFLLEGCGSFKAKRVSGDESDELSMEITDKWVARDTEIAIKAVLEKISKHRGFKKYLRKLGREPKLFIGEIQNRTADPYFPIDDMNDEMLTDFSESGDYVLIDAARRDSLLKEIQYQNDGMVSPREVKSVGKAAGADLMIFGAVRMKPMARKGKTMKQYSVNIRMTNIQRGTEVVRVRTKINKFSDQKSTGW